MRSDVVLVEATGFEPTTSASRTQRSTKLSHASFYSVSTSRFAALTNNLYNYIIQSRKNQVLFAKIPKKLCFALTVTQNYVIITAALKIQ